MKARETLATQPMMQRQPNTTDLRSMDSYNQILCRFQKSKLKLHRPPSVLKNPPLPPDPPRDDKFLPLAG